MFVCSVGGYYSINDTSSSIEIAMILKAIARASWPGYLGPTEIW